MRYDPFYDAPADVPDRPGELLRHQPLQAKWLPQGARAWRILYTTTLEDDRPAIASGLVIAPGDGSGEDGVPRHLLAWAHGSSGISQASAPSRLSKGLESGALLVTEEILARGWAVVATDYPGLGTSGAHPWLVGQPAGRSVLDSVRAARALPMLTLSGRTALWGHSQGGHAALWAGQLAPEYTPDLELAGVAALAPPADVAATVAGFDRMFAGRLFQAYTLEAYCSYYDDVTEQEYLHPGARRLVRQLVSRPLSDPRSLVAAVLSSALRRHIWKTDPLTGALGARLVQNCPTAAIASPLLIAMGTKDEIVPVPSLQQYVASRRAAGQEIDFRLYDGLGHIPLVRPGSPCVQELLAWTSDRLAGGLDLSGQKVAADPRP